MGVFSFIIFSFFIRKLISSGAPVDIYIPHPGNIFSNFLFFSDRNGGKVFIYEDGLLNYYDAISSNTFVGRCKKLLARVFGTPYRDYSGHLAGYDAGKYDGAFLSMPDKAVRKERLGTLNRMAVSACNERLKEKTVLFLDQNSAKILDPVERDLCVSTMLGLCPPSEYHYYYKAHHDYMSHLADAMVLLPENLQNLPAEIVVERLRPSHVISFFSSALINVKMAWPNVECISLAASKINITRDGEQCLLSDLFEGAGVKCLGETVVDRI